jgi:hypothetical protein
MNDLVCKTRSGRVANYWIIVIGRSKTTNRSARNIKSPSCNCETAKTSSMTMKTSWPSLINSFCVSTKFSRIKTTKYEDSSNAKIN